MCDALSHVGLHMPRKEARRSLSREQCVCLSAPGAGAATGPLSLRRRDKSEKLSNRDCLCRITTTSSRACTTIAAQRRRTPSRSSFENSGFLPGPIPEKSDKACPMAVSTSRSPFPPHSAESTGRVRHATVPCACKPGRSHRGDRIPLPKGAPMSPSAPRSALGSARPLEPPEAAAGAAPVEPPPEPPSLHHCTDALLADLARAVSRGVGGGALQWGAGLLAGVVAGTAAWALAGSLRVGAVAAGVLAGGVGVWTALLCLEWLVESAYKVLEKHHEDVRLQSSRFFRYVMRSAQGSRPGPSIAVHYTRAVPRGSEERGKAESGVGEGGVDESREGKSPERKAPSSLCVHLWHGFGANVTSWLAVQQPLSDALGATVTAHDMPGFGLTERTRDMRVYKAAVDADIGLRIATGAEGGEEGDDGASDGGTERESGRGRDLVLVGHSMGSISAAEACLASPHRVKALVLVAPALIAPQRLLSLAPPLSPAHQPPGPSFPSGTPPLSPPVSLLEALRLPGTRPPADGAREGLGVVAWAVGAARWVIGHTVLRVLQPVALAAMRAFVRREQSWKATLQRVAWWDGKKVPEALVAGYMRPQAVKGWDHGLLRWMRVRLANGHSLLDSVTSAMTEHRAPLVARLANAVEEHSIPVLVVHGRHDLAVPLRAGEGIARVLPGARLAVVEQTAHCPQEEVPDTFVGVVSDFLRDVDGGAGKERGLVGEEKGA